MEEDIKYHYGFYDFKTKKEIEDIYNYHKTENEENEENENEENENEENENEVYYSELEQDFIAIRKEIIEIIDKDYGEIPF